MPIYFESLQQFQQQGGLKQTTITAKQLLPALVTHMQRGDRKFTLYVNGRLPKSFSELLNEAFSISHLQQPFYTQHCARQQSSYLNVSKNRLKVDFTLTYRMSRDEQNWVEKEIASILKTLVTNDMTPLEKVIAVHDYIVRNHQYEMNTTGSPFTVYTFMHEKQGVCMAYALLFEKMMTLLSIPCLYVLGKADGESDLGHAWNMVQLDGNWYHIDATWNDLGSKLPNHEIRYRYFLRSDRFMERDHHWNHDHYPMCTSEIYKGLSNVYDVTYVDGQLYYPHPKKAYFMTMDANTRVENVLLQKRVQFCTAYDGVVYFSHFDDDRALYTFDPLKDDYTKLDERAVTSISRTLDRLTVTFTDGEPLVVEKEADAIERQFTGKDVELSRFGDSYFGSYKGKAEPLRFVSDNGVEVHLKEGAKQVAIDVLVHNGLNVQMTVNKKPLQNTEVELFIPKDLYPALATSALFTETADYFTCVFTESFTC